MDEAVAGAKTRRRGLADLLHGCLSLSPTSPFTFCALDTLRLCTTEDLALVIVLLTFVGASLWLLTTTLQFLWAICGRLLSPSS